MLKVGIIGAGMIVPFSLDSFKKIGEVELLAIADSDSGRANKLAQSYNIPKTYSSAAELIRNKDIDIVYVALPNKFHIPVSLAALRAGKQVISEKPMAMSYAEAMQIKEALKGTELKYMVGQNQRFESDSQKIKALAAKSYFGDIYHAKAFWRRRNGIPKQGTWFGHDASSGGGSILDLGVHMLDLALFIMDNFAVEAVSSASYTKFGNRGLGYGGWGLSDDEKQSFDVDDSSCALLKLKGGASLILDIAWASHMEENDKHNVEIFGSKAGAQCYPAKVFHFDKDLESNVNVELKGAETVESSYSGMVIKYPHCDRFANFVAAVLGEEELCVKLEESLQVQKILDAIKESAKTGSELRL